MPLLLLGPLLGFFGKLIGDPPFRRRDRSDQAGRRPWLAVLLWAFCQACISPTTLCAMKLTRCSSQLWERFCECKRQNWVCGAGGGDRVASPVYWDGCFVVKSRHTLRIFVGGLIGAAIFPCGWLVAEGVAFAFDLSIVDASMWVLIIGGMTALGAWIAGMTK